MRGFTLIEVLLSVTLLLLVFTTLYFVIDNFRNSNTFYNDKLEEIIQDSSSRDIIYLDFVGGSDFNITNKDQDHDTICFQTDNSLYNLPLPYVCWLVLKDKDVLTRIESPDSIKLPIRDGAEVRADAFDQNITLLRSYMSKEKDGSLVFVGKDDKISFSFYVPILTSSAEQNNSTSLESNSSS